MVVRVPVMTTTVAPSRLLAMVAHAPAMTAMVAPSRLLAMTPMAAPDRRCSWSHPGLFTGDRLRLEGNRVDPAPHTS
jgi:hypothetical protein